MYWFSKVRERKARVLDQVKCIDDEEDNVLTDEILIKQRCQAYIHKLMNEAKDIETMLGDLEYSGRHLDIVGVLRLRWLSALLVG